MFPSNARRTAHGFPPPVPKFPPPLRLLLIALTLLLASCNTAEQSFARPAVTVSLTADGETQTIETSASNVRELLTEANLTLGEADEVDPPPFTPLTPDLAVRVVRVSESVELIERTIPFERKIVRNENMAAEDPAVILQPGQTGREELTVRIVYRDGLEVERRVTQSTVVEEAQDEIVMVGLGVALPNNVSFGGTLAFIQGGQAVIMRSNTAFPETLNIGEPETASAAPAELDRRVFTLSPTGSHLLFTRV
ncbi:MAG: G5 domain-containing protein, partial [Anaerolineales bacterium]|nr:G5 domain-containing protein [Anaerolineales bacterium]